MSGSAEDAGDKPKAGSGAGGDYGTFQGPPAIGFPPPGLSASAHPPRHRTNLLVDTLKKALASQGLEKTSLKLKENIITSERTKQLLDRTPPRSRRLSLENATSIKARMPERKAPKSPRSAMSFTRDQGITHDKECSTDGFQHTMHHKSMPASFPEDAVREENEKIISTVDTVEFFQVPPDAYNNQFKQSGLNTPEITPCRSRNMSAEASHTGDPCTTAKVEKIMTSNATKKGSHLRKSIQSSIGRLIHGTERRNAQHSTLGTPAKITTNSCHDIASPVIADIKLRRRQSLTGLPPPPSTMLRRSSLGGKSDISSNNKSGSKTPPVNSIAKAKRWL